MSSQIEKSETAANGCISRRQFVGGSAVALTAASSSIACATKRISKANFSENEFAGIQTLADQFRNRRPHGLQFEMRVALVHLRGRVAG